MDDYIWPMGSKDCIITYNYVWMFIFVPSACLILMNAFVRAQACAYSLQYLHRNCETMSGIRATFLSGTWRTFIIDMMKCLKHRFHVDSNLSCVDLVGRRLAAAHQPRATSCDCRFRGTSLYHGRVKFPWWFAGLLPGGTKKSLSAYGCIWHISTPYQIPYGGRVPSQVVLD